MVSLPNKTTCNSQAVYHYYYDLHVATTESASFRAPGRTIRVPDQPDGRTAWRPLEPDCHPRRHVRKPASLSGAACAERGGHRLEHPRRPAKASDGRRSVDATP